MLATRSQLPTHAYLREHQECPSDPSYCALKVAMYHKVTKGNDSHVLSFASRSASFLDRSRKSKKLSADPNLQTQLSQVIGETKEFNQPGHL